MVWRIDRKFRILHIGCGSSQMSMQLYDMGYKNITNVDYSQVLIENSQSLYPNMKRVYDDIRSLATIPSCSFDVVLEKATIEALLVKEKSPWSSSEEALATVESIFKAVARVLTSDGVFVSISFIQPYFRVPALLRVRDWSVTVKDFGEFFQYFIYVMQRGKGAPREMIERYAHIAPQWSRPLLNK
ncbi:unnamed protein product [Strongylus vulgaris]|uniref:Methyltransferase type 11 domain-containing protein n=1 Tax=Strongylus vulgaris TaxID=40348 RepID=A0A3P7L6B0_STRVU|nr:unnamed protein product [Strongylus vulgaris]